MAFWNRKSNRELLVVARSIEKSSKVLADSITEASRDDVKARDRVDITLEEYERLKEENRRLNEEVSSLRVILTSFRFPVNLWQRVKTDTIKTSVRHDIKDFIDTFHIAFDVDVPYPYGEDYKY